MRRPSTAATVPLRPPASKPPFFPSFAQLLAGALMLSMFPLLSSPFDWMETLFHELSHGLAAIVTGGTVLQIHLEAYGGGWCLYLSPDEGARLPITLAGYSGAVVWGMLVYLSALPGRKWASLLLAFLLAVLIVSSLLWVRDAMTLSLMAIMAVFFYVAILFQASKRFRRAAILRGVLMFTGLYVVTGAMRTPIYLLLIEGVGDAVDAQGLTGMAAMYWILLWEAFAWCGLWVLWYASRRARRVGALRKAQLAAA